MSGYRCQVSPNRINSVEIIIEVLSDSTQNYDKTEKFRAYRSLPSLQEYILISQSGYYVEQFIKQSEQQWLFNVIEGENSNLELASIDFSISFSQLYQRIVFE